MFTDMCGSTEMLTQLGDLGARRLFRLHDEIVRAELAAHAGFEVEQQGDGFVLAFGSARDAVLAAIAMQRGLASLDAESDHAIEVRIGLHTGEAIKDAEKFFGLAVVLASRITGQARAGEILVSSVVHELTRTAGDVRFGPPRTVALKGTTEPQRVFAVDWAPAP
jgi:class 3 adenylate cyclase